MPDPIRILFLGQGRTDAIEAELQRGGYLPCMDPVTNLTEFTRAMDRSPDVAISDTVAGETGALQALRAIQTRGIDLPLIVVSGRIADAEVVEVLAAGAADHITRPSLKRLDSAVRRELRSVRLRRERAGLEEQIQQAQKMEAVGRLAAGVAHDFNNLLTIVAGYADLLLQNKGLDASFKTGLEEIRRAADRGGALTYQLLSLSRRQPLEVRAVSVNALLLRMERMLRRLIGENINLATIPAADPDTVECDPGRLEQVILSLVVNARDAMPEGGSLSIETGLAKVGTPPEEGQLAVGPGRYVTLAVSDNGVGMDAETRSRVFEPFFTTKARGSGGLGLALAYRMTQQVGGAIGIASEAGRGTKVQIYLPLLRKKRQVRKQQEGAKRLTGKETILVVEDEAPSQKA